MSEQVRAAGRPSKSGTLDSAIDAATERPEIRDSLRPDDPRERARLRTESIMSHIGDLDGGTDEFYIPPDAVPDGWTYEWKRWSVLNQEDPHYHTALRRMGWDYVPSSRHPEMMPLGSRDEMIFRKGQVLMERPAEITDLIKINDKKRAREQVRIKEEQLSAPPPGTFERNNKNSSLVSVKKGWGPVAPKD